MNRSLMLAALIAAPLITAPARAQPAPPPPPVATNHEDRGMHGSGRMFPSMSEAGRKIVHDAMQAGGNRREDRQKLEAVRDKLLSMLSADRLDVAAVRRVMDEERALGEASRLQRQNAMLAAVQKLSVEDRKAFVADSRAMKNRMQSRMDGWRNGWRDRMQQRRGMQPAAPPAPPQLEI